MSARMYSPIVGALAGALLLGSVCSGAPGLNLSGSITGVVANSAGVPQMGATVFLYNRFDRLVDKSITTETGTFDFKSLVPDTYAIRVSMASFLPALKRNIVVQPGMQSLLSVNLTSIFSSIELVGLAPGRHPIMSDEWKWVLRSASATRPALRYLPELDKPEQRRASVFSGTHGMVKVSAGDQPQSSALGSQPDLGTAFALATSFLGKNKLELSGNVGYGANSGAPAAAIRTSYRREGLAGSSPEVQVTMRQVFMPARAGAVLMTGMERNAPLLRSISAQFMNEAQLASNVRLEYGSSADTVSFLETLNYFSPYARLTVDGDDERLQVAYSSGLPPAELYLNEGGTAMDLQKDLTALSLFPRISVAGGRVRLQRAQSVEAGYSKRVGSRTYSFGAHMGKVSNAAVTVAGADGMKAPELLPDLFSRTHVLNAGNYSTNGYLLAVTQSLGRNFDATLSWSAGDALTADAAEQTLLEELRQAVDKRRRHSLTARVAGNSPLTGTQFVASYQWANIDGLTPPHVYMTQNVREGVGLNFRLRQALPASSLFPGRFEATADLENLLEQGYVPILCDGHQLVLMHTPRSLRGGVSFIF